MSVPGNQDDQEEEVGNNEKASEGGKGILTDNPHEPSAHQNKPASDEHGSDTEPQDQEVSCQ